LCQKVKENFDFVANQRYLFKLKLIIEYKGTMEKIQLIFFFLNGFLVSRLFIKVKLPERVVFHLIHEQNLSIRRILLYIIGLSSCFSLFIPNAITVLTLLPIIALLLKAYRDSDTKAKNISTMMALAVIYGANIGGMGSITASPANGILATFLALNKVPDSEKLTFASWLIWGIPLIIIFSLIAWGVLIIFFRPGRFEKTVLTLPFSLSEITHPHQVYAIGLTLLYFISSIALSAWMMISPNEGKHILIITATYSIVFISFIFLFPVTAKGSTHRRPMLIFADIYSDLPLRGFLFVAIAIALGAVLYALNVHLLFQEFVPKIFPKNLHPYLTLLLIALLTSFGTEFLSNTAVQIAMFLVLITLSKVLTAPLLIALIVTTLSCTSAFMSPIATGVNGLAFGAIPNVSLWRMLVVGFWMNIIGAALISAWGLFFIGWLYGL
jgi:sodium-dependent dicarboxylate transporter 2/3/5